ncbi:MAG: hypothetical protein JST73_02685 [Actinobacteria bacterium]|nr:hypothetical protein [Actinomycetota bacterium]
MAIPSYVPVDPRLHPRDYRPSPGRGNGWRRGARPGEIVPNAMPQGGLFGNHGPDIGYAYKLVHRVSDRIKVVGNEQREDAEAGAIAVAMRRAARNGRAPILADLEVALTIWGFFDDQPASGLRVMRAELFEGAHAEAHGYDLRREIAAAVSDHALAMTPAAVTAAHAQDWASLFVDR